MKKINIKYSVKSFEQLYKNLNKVLGVFTSEEPSHLEINLVMDSIDAAQIKKIINYIVSDNIFKEITNENIYTFVLTIKPTQDIINSLVKIKWLLSRIDVVYDKENKSNFNEFLLKLSKRKLPFFVLIKETDFDEVMKIYHTEAKLGVHLSAESDFSYDEDFMCSFKEWLYDKNGCRINIFADMLSRILLDYWGTKCQYKSCLTKYFYIDSSNNIYCCKAAENNVCNLNDIKSIKEIYCNERFVALLKKSINKREQCKNQCEFYELCQGGCPLNSDLNTNKCTEKNLFLIMNNINELIRQIINNADYRGLNPAVKDMILSSIASNKIFEKGMII